MDPLPGHRRPIAESVHARVISCCASVCLFFFSSRRRHTRFDCDWSSDVCSSDLEELRGLRQAWGGCGIVLVVEGDRERVGGRGPPADLVAESLARLAQVLHRNRSGEGRVGEEGRTRWLADYLKKKTKKVE